MYEKSLWLLLVVFSTKILANPFPNPNKVPKDVFGKKTLHLKSTSLTTQEVYEAGKMMLRIDIDWNAASGEFEFSEALWERSGTEGLYLRAKKEDPHGSYRARLLDPISNEAVYFDSIGTGYLFKRLSRGLSFRFPLIDKPLLLQVHGENEQSGDQDLLIEKLIDPKNVKTIPFPTSELDAGELEVRNLRRATIEPAIIINIYAEGYRDSGKSGFWKKAERTASLLLISDLPLKDRYEINAVFKASRQMIGRAEILSETTVLPRDSYLGLYFPYWERFGRWYNIVYPTDYKKYRTGIGKVAYDYPIILIDSHQYFGVGNFRELTAVPDKNFSFEYLLLHEFGHFFGLNEEYSSGGRTELEFAPNIREPWSQNITFHPKRGQLKWESFVDPSTPLPTPSRGFFSRVFRSQRIGAYTGAYAESQPVGKAYKPTLSCTMKRAESFCDICRTAIQRQIEFDLGI